MTGVSLTGLADPAAELDWLRGGEAALSRFRPDSAVGWLNRERRAAVWSGAARGADDGPLGAQLAEIFPTRHRYTGAGVAYNIAGVLGAVAKPVVVHRSWPESAAWPWDSSSLRSPCCRSSASLRSARPATPRSAKPNLTATRRPTTAPHGDQC